MPIEDIPTPFTRLDLGNQLLPGNGSCCLYFTLGHDLGREGDKSRKEQVAIRENQGTGLCAAAQAAVRLRSIQSMSMSATICSRGSLPAASTNRLFTSRQNSSASA